MTIAELREAQRASEEARERARFADKHRNHCVWRALVEGWTHTQISLATGLTRGRIGQIAANQKENR